MDVLGQEPDFHEKIEQGNSWDDKLIVHRLPPPEIPRPHTIMLYLASEMYKRDMLSYRTQFPAIA